MKNHIFTIIFISICTFFLNAQTVPAVYQPLYSELESSLQQADNYIDNLWNGEAFCSRYTIDLKYANTTIRKSALLEPSGLILAKQVIDAYDSYGVTGLRMHPGYPFLVDSFPNSSAYLDFFSEVVQYARSKNFTIFIKSAITPNNPDYGPVDSVVFNFMNGKTRDQYLTEKLQMLQTIIDTLAPDYLTMENEPTSMEAATGLNFSFAPDSIQAYLAFYTNHLAPNNVKLGAGAGSWEDIEFFEKISAVPGLDYVDMHVYPVVLDLFTSRIVNASDVIIASGKNIMYGECWLNKQGISDLVNQVPATEISKRNFFSFWQPLDSMFAHILSKYAQHYQADLVTMFQPDRFFAYLDYQPGYENLPISQINLLTYPTLVQNIQNGTFSPIGDDYLDIIDLACENAVGITSENDALPQVFALAQNYPNPFNPSTTIKYEIPNAGFVSLTVYDITGKKVTALVNESQNAGIYSVHFDGSRLASGVYLYRLQSGRFSAAKKFVLMK